MGQAQQKQEEDIKVIKVTPVFERAMHKLVNDTFAAYVRAGFHIAALTHPGFEFDYIPSIEESQDGNTAAETGVDDIAYNKDAQERDDTKKALTGGPKGQWNFLTNMVDQSLESDELIEALESVEFHAERGYVEQYNIIREDKLANIKRKKDAEEALIYKKRHAKDNATAEVKARLARRFA